MGLLRKPRWITTGRRLLVGGLILILGLEMSHLFDLISDVPDDQILLLRNRYLDNPYEYQICDYEWMTHNESKTLENILIQDRVPTPNILLLSSFGRSGSSFLGGLITTIPGVFYYFEPFYNLEQWNMLTPSLAVQSLKDLFKCNFTGPVFTAMKARGKKSLRHPYLGKCGPKNICMEAPRLTSVCSSEPIRMVKTIRTRLSWVEPLLRNPSLNLRVIHLVRDPRGAIISNWKNGWDVSAQTLCGNLLEDLESGKHIQQRFPDRYIAVRYEDICADPGRIATTIFHFLGYVDPLPSTIRFLEEKTSQEDADAFSLRRNSSSHQQKWRYTITEQELLQVEEACSRAITDLGFNLFGDLNNTRNFNTPLFNPSKFNSLFSHKDCINI